MVDPTYSTPKKIPVYSVNFSVPSVQFPLGFLRNLLNCNVCLKMGPEIGKDNIHNEKALRETQTLHAGCSKAEPKIFAPLQRRRPPSRGRGTAKI